MKNGKGKKEERAVRPAIKYESRSTDFYYRSEGERRTPLTCRAHLHYHIECFYLCEGRVTVWVDSVVYTAEAGDLVMVFPNQLHRFRSEVGGCEKYKLFIVSPDLVPDFAAVFNLTLPHSPIVKGICSDSRLLGIIDGLSAVSAADPAKYTAEVQKGYITAFFGLLLPQMPLDEVRLGDSRAVREVVSFCSQNYTGDLSLEVLERTLHLNKYYISHLFSSKLGIRFNDYVNSLRVSHACRLLRETSLPVTEISDIVGFNTQRTFNRAFARFRGLSPVEYRRASGDGAEAASFPPIGATPAAHVVAAQDKIHAPRA